MNRIKNIIAAFLFFGSIATAQMQLLQVLGPGLEKELTSVLSVGAVPVGENITVTLRVRNTSSTAALTIATLTLLPNAPSSVFTKSGQPSLPHQLAPGLNMDVDVKFSPRDFGAYNANFSVNGISVVLTGSSTAAPTLSVAGVAFSSGSTVDIGLAERGTAISKTFRIENTTSERVRVQSGSVTGKDFRLSQNLPLPLELAPHAVYDFGVTFAPTASGVFQGALVLDGRSYRITGAANEPPFPKPTIVVDLVNPTSAQQGMVSVRFGEASRSIGPGKLRMEFRPSSAVASDDVAVRFTRGTSRLAGFDVTEGVSIPLSDMTFQTGTTAGTIVFIAEVGGWTATASVEIAPERVHIDKTRAIKNGSMLEIEITGYDNSRTVDGLVFTFFSSKGETLQPGAIRVNTATDFRRHFEGSTLGGVFTLKAVFPVAGAIADIASTEVQLTNASGNAQSAKTQIQ